MNPTFKFLESRKARALVIALLNCDLVFFVSIFTNTNPALSSALITATLALAGLYIGAQGAVDSITALRTTTSPAVTTDGL